MRNMGAKRDFSNNRQWREFIAAVHETLSIAAPAREGRANEALRWGTSANWLRTRRDFAFQERQTGCMRVDVAVSLA
jgi:hypothetical protein